MKKLLVVLLGLLLLSSTCFASRKSYEPEWDNGFSFSCMTVHTDMEITFVKYTCEGGQDEYWMRAYLLRSHNKMLPSIKMNIDGKEYIFNALRNPDAKYAEAAQKLIANTNMNFSGEPQRTFPRIFLLTREQFEQIMNAKLVSFSYDTANSINNKEVIDTDIQKDMKDIYKLEYKDYPTYWKPKDKK